ncbi:MAG: hypothetical protein NTV33_11650 [Coprothermobacterota bacterium]|nr:hypothetical protein [Coprothermobacterota bacterium]
MRTYDLYDYDTSSRGAGLWSFMGAGYYWHFDAFNKDLLGWLEPTTVIINQECVLPPVESTGKAIKVPILGRPNEYFLLENRQNIGSFERLPGYGLLIWHIDESVDTNNRNEWYPSHTNTGHYLAAVEQADGLWELETNINTGNAADIFSSECSFTPSSVSNSHAYDGTDSNLYVTNIHYEGLNVVFTISFGQPPIPLSPSVETTVRKGDRFIY